MRVMRIAHSSLTPALRRRERALVQRYPDVDLQVITAEAWREAEMDVPGTPDDLFPVSTASTHFSKHIQLFAYDPRPIVRVLREHKPHIVDLGHEPYSVACAEVLTLCRWFAPQAVVVMHSNQNICHRYPPPFNWLEQRAFRRVTAAYACSETVREVLRLKGFHKPAPLISYGVDIDAFRPNRDPGPRVAGKPTIGYVGRMLPGKGLDVLAEALKKVSGEEWQLLVVGDGSERAGFEQSLASAGLLERAKFTGAISFDRVPEYFKELDVMVIPTQTTRRIREQFGRVIVEAMASGVPVIGSTCGAIPEVIGEAGMIFQEGDPESLANCLRQLLPDAAMRARFAAAGRERVEQHYSWDRIADRMYELYCSVLTKREAPAGRGSLATAHLLALSAVMIQVFDSIL